MSFLAPLAFLGGLIAIPIILLYMLRLRRREVIVSSNFLWQQVIQDQEANTPWQRLRRNILLILQLIILALLVSALARPASVVATITAGKTVVLLDASASMNATDMPQGQTRFAAAQARARELIGDMGANDQMALIRVADVAEPLIEYTDNANALREAINRALVGQGQADWNTALTLAAAGAEGAEAFNIIILSDGGLGDVGALPENIPQPVYIPIGQSSSNVAITALATRALPGEMPQLFAQVQNYGGQAADVSLVVRLDGELWDSTRQTISGNSQRSFVFQIDQPFERIEADLVYDDDNVTDYLSLDDRAWTVAQTASTRRVLLVTDEANVFIEQGLRSLPGVQVFRGDTGTASLPSQPYDLYVFNGWLPDTLPDADMLIVNPPRDTALFDVVTPDDETDAPQTRATMQIAAPDHPLMAFMQSVTSVNVRAIQAIDISGSTWAQTLLTANDAPVLLAGNQGGRQVVLMPLNLRDTDLPLNIAWPILLSNMIDWFTPADIITAGSIGVGQTQTVRPPIGADAVRLTLPDGTTQMLPVTSDALTLVDTAQPGIYRVDVLREGDDIAGEYFAVNVFATGTDSRSESDITPVPENALRLGGGVVDAEAAEQPSLREYWPFIAAAVLAMLLVEWHVYHRRLQVPTIGAVLRPNAARAT